MLLDQAGHESVGARRVMCLDDSCLPPRRRHWIIRGGTSMRVPGLTQMKVERTLSAIPRGGRGLSGLPGHPGGRNS
jgi:hypothetical protein